MLFSFWPCYDSLTRLNNATCKRHLLLWNVHYKLFNHMYPANTDSTQRAQTIEMDRTIRKMNSSFMWISLTTCFCQVSVDFIYLCLFRIVISYVVHYKRHSVPKRSHLLGHEYTRNQGCHEMFHMREESLLIVLKGLK